MLLVPLPNDIITTLGGVQHTVLSYTAYKNKPTVYVQGEGASTTPIAFSEILSINEVPVQLTTGKVFLATSKFNQRFHLPQPYDLITVDGDELITVKVKSLKLFERGHLSNGMQIRGIDVDTSATVLVRLIDVIKIHGAELGAKFSRSKFRAVYKDYLGAEHN